MHNCLHPQLSFTCIISPTPVAYTTLLHESYQHINYLDILAFIMVLMMGNILCCLVVLFFLLLLLLLHLFLIIQHILGRHTGSSSNTPGEQLLGDGQELDVTAPYKYALHSSSYLPPSLPPSLLPPSLLLPPSSLPPSSLPPSSLPPPSLLPPSSLPPPSLLPPSSLPPSSPPQDPVLTISQGSSTWSLEYDHALYNAVHGFYCARIEHPNALFNKRILQLLPPSPPSHPVLLCSPTHISTLMIHMQHVSSELPWQFSACTCVTAHPTNLNSTFTDGILVSVPIHMCLNDRTVYIVLYLIYFYNKPCVHLFLSLK